MMRVEWMNSVAQADPAILPLTANAPGTTEGDGVESRQNRMGTQPVEAADSAQENRSSGSREKEGPEDDLGRMVRELNKELSSQNRVAQIKVDESINRRYISVIEKESRKVVQEFPPEEIRGYIRTIRDITAKGDESRSLKDPGLLDLEA